ncbi:polynucleotide adenylyltransferase PcnB [Vibrio sp. SS-MA-C1-2]|uniref:polynucleotide adenylyltransferase PcnB n=1 Tax=Vibrio sp. SS-MA-C1-2 TaxID=2908646 RepID=UPI001F462A3D|nr:polynucleotide adenylyltransferase PcnB [Vibrio sp. SS-MA-C1-2]UJF19642.1 polynucleotide adenylyltransferase PcnB [Vibrio sp. SS-MA-C1-2]
MSLQIFPRDQHCVSRKNISDNALKVLFRLHKAGYQAYLVGGGVRDLLLELPPKDFDIATNATPDEIKKLFRNCRLIGRRFRLAHILFGREVIEVATLRGHHDSDKLAQQVSSQSDEGMLLRDNVYGSIDEDAERRDFTINAMYYDIADYSIRDYAGGIADLEQGIIRLIGDPDVRYREDPVRMLRAVRFAAKLDMTIAARTADPIPHLASLLHEIPAARLFEESSKLLQSGHGVATYQLLRQYQLFEPLFPQVHQYLTEDGQSETEQIINIALASTDKRINQGLRVNPAFMFAALLWYPLTSEAKRISTERNIPYYDAFLIAMNEVISKQVKAIAIPKRFTAMIRDIWLLQLRLPRRSGKRAFRLMEQDKFRAAYDFLEMRGKVEGGKTEELANWWTLFQDKGHNYRQYMVQNMNEHPAKRPRKRKKKQPESEG